MPTYLSPGVYVEEVEAGARPIEGVGTSVAAFVGLAQDGPINEPIQVTNWSQFTQTFGDFVEGSYLAHAVYGYFLNGGGTCYVVRIGGDVLERHVFSARIQLGEGQGFPGVGYLQGGKFGKSPGGAAEDLRQPLHSGLVRSVGRVPAENVRQAVRTGVLRILLALAGHPQVAPPGREGESEKHQ